ncbi:MAG: membrane protein insertion efficiency factor YidD [Polyangiaceae bacterium]
MLAAVLIALVRVYQLTLSKLILYTMGPVCRFQPSCSHYAVACLRDHGALRGSLLSAKRLCKCHPFHPGGYDPPPPAPLKKGAAKNPGMVASPSSPSSSPDPSALSQNGAAPTARSQSSLRDRREDGTITPST